MKGTNISLLEGTQIHLTKALPMEGNPIHSFTTTKRALSRGNSFKCMIRRASLTSLYTQLDILSLSLSLQLHTFFPFNIEVIMANCLSTAGVILLEYYHLIDATQLELQTIQR